MIRPRILKIIIAILLLADIVYSFNQHYHFPLDGDMSHVILPFDGFQKAMHDPFGINALKGDVYLATNRSFAHWTMSLYFKSIPFVCQTFTDPLDSLYLSCAIAKTIIQVLLITLLSFYISKTWNIFSMNFLVAALLVTPLFQTLGFYNYMGVIDNSITYTFFYALPLSLLILFFIPIFIAKSNDSRLKIGYIKFLFLIILFIYLSFNGPLISATSILVSALVILYNFYKYFLASTKLDPLHRTIDAIKRFDKVEILIYSTIILVSLYSLYIGKFNSSNYVNQIPLSKRFFLLIIGIVNYLTKSLGPILLITVIVANTIIIKRFWNNPEALRILKQIKWIGLLAFIYILLLPFGGYREYRPYIIRWDTIMPITLVLFYYFGLSSLFIINSTKSRIKFIYSSIIALILIVFTIVDKPHNTNLCEREALKTLASSTEKIVKLDYHCGIMEWAKVIDYNRSKSNTMYLRYVGVLKEEKYYYQP